MGTVANEGMRTYGVTNTKDLVEMYPIGSIYISVDSTSPASLFGGTWQQLEEGQFLMNTYLSDKLNQPIAAGLPNIKGRATVYTYTPDYEGALYQSDVTDDVLKYGSNADFLNLRIDASRGQIYTDDSGTEHYTTETGYTDKTIYGKSNTVQPYSLGVRIWKRINPTS